MKKFSLSVLFSLVVLGLAVPVSAQQLTSIGGSRAFVAGPENAAASVIVVHDWFGISDMTKATVRRLGSMGYRTVAVDLYGGESATDHQTAGQLLGGLDQDAAQQVIAAALAYVSSDDRPVAVVGFSAGALPALRAAALNHEVRAMVGVYGGNLEQVDPTRLTQMPANVLLISGSVDGWAMGSVESVQQTLVTVEKAAEVYVYPNGGHGFAQPLWNGGSNLDPVATRVSWMLIDDFLERNLI